MKKHTTIQMVWNNVQFVPEKEGVWYRGIDEDVIYNSSIRKGNKRIEVSFYTYGDILNKEELKEAWDARVYEGNQIIDSKDRIEAQNVDDAENQALEWASEIW